MRKITILIVFLFLGLVTKAQEHFYYYKGEKIPLTLNKERVNFRASSDFDRTELERNNLKINYLSEDDAAYFGEVEIGTKDYQQSIDNIRNIKGVLNVFPHFAKTETNSIGTSDIFYIKLKNIKDLSLLERDAEVLGCKIVNAIPNMPLWIIVKLDDNAKMTSVEAANKLFEKGVYAEMDPAFMFDFKPNCTNDSDFSSLWGLKNNTYPGMDINVCPAWNITTGAGIKIAILDQGIDTNHLDLSGNIHSVSYDAKSGTSPSVFGNEEHGTHVAGIAGAIKDNNLQVTGVAPSAKLIPVSHSMYISTTISAELADGIAWAWQNGADVINNSWGDQGIYYNKLYSPALENAIEDAMALGRNGKGTVVVFASGNNAPPMEYPGNFHDDILTVGAMQKDGKWRTSSSFGDKLDVVAPGENILSTIPYNEIDSLSGTSMAAPHVSGIAALVLSVNPDLTGKEVRDIIESTAKKVRTDEYTYTVKPTRPNGTWYERMGYGLVDAYAAVQKAQETLKQDLYIRISPFDGGYEPRTYVSYTWLWDSPDIWNRRFNDNGTTHQNVEYLGPPHNYINIRITNRGKVPSTVQDSVRLHWAKAGTTQDWDMYWNGNLKYNNIPLGGVVATKAIPVLQPGQSTVVKIPWSNVPNPISYGQIFENSQSFSLLARIISEDDPMTFPEGFNLMTNVKNNNNIGWKNVTVLFARLYHLVPIGDVIIVRNPVDRIKLYDIGFKIDAEDVGKPVFQEAEVALTLDPVLYEAWERGGKQSYNVREGKQTNEVIVTGDNAKLKNVTFLPEEMGVLSLSFNFLTQEITPKESHLYHIYQEDVEESEVIGGTSFLIEKTERELFNANAGNDIAVNKNEVITLSADDIGETAVYNWYDEDRNLLHEGKNYQIALDSNKKLTLEVIASVDGYKDYDEVSVTLKPNMLKAIAPNPASSSITVSYVVNNADSAYISVVPVYGGVPGNETNYVLNIDEQQMQIDLLGYANGVYKVILYCNGNLVSSENLIINH
ncbi:subtilase family protein [Myroides indicus]|uniref:Subtilase family protein n=2 Tax=Myroides indicus TaxID=1323422 RepID=A0A4R7EWI4_9FLAO|nr:subtilase family protein [Myroides indicus]